METYTRESRSLASHKRVVCFQTRLADAGLAPKITSDAYPFIEMERGTPLSEWLKSPAAEDRQIMRARLMTLVRGVHAAGICHRDLHIGNVMLSADGSPLAIDLEHGLDVNPQGPCFDVWGPSSGLPVAPAHVQIGGTLAETGVWWDAPLSLMQVTTLGSKFGPWPAS